MWSFCLHTSTCCMIRTCKSHNARVNGNGDGVGMEKNSWDWAGMGLIFTTVSLCCWTAMPLLLSAWKARNIVGHTVVSSSTLYVVSEWFSSSSDSCSWLARHSDEAAADNCSPARHWPSCQVYRRRSSYSWRRWIRFLLSFCYYKTLYFRCVLISRFWNVEILLHFNLAFSQSVFY